MSYKSINKSIKLLKIPFLIIILIIDVSITPSDKYDDNYYYTHERKPKDV